jgi:hypothetical protein
MWIRIRAVIIENELLAAQYLAELLDDTCQIEVVGSATESEAGMRLCAEYGVLFDKVGFRTIKTTPLDNGYVMIETAVDCS